MITGLSSEIRDKCSVFSEQPVNIASERLWYAQFPRVLDFLLHSHSRKYCVQTLSASFPPSALENFAIYKVRMMKNLFVSIQEDGMCLKRYEGFAELIFYSDDGCIYAYSTPFILIFATIFLIR